MSRHLGSDSLQTSTDDDGEHVKGLAELGVQPVSRWRGKTGTGPSRTPPGALQLRVRAVGAGAGASPAAQLTGGANKGSVEVDEDDATSTSDTPQPAPGAASLLRTGGGGTSFLTSKLTVGGGTPLADEGDQASMDTTSEFSSAGEEEDDSDYDAEELDLGDEAAAEEAFGGNRVGGAAPILPDAGAEWEAYCRGLAARGDRAVRLGGGVAALYATCAFQVR